MKNGREYVRSIAGERDVRSERRQIADRLARVIIDCGMTRPFGGDVQMSNDKRCYDILFSMPATLDGLVRVFSPTFILIKTAGRASHEPDWQGAYACESDARTFLQAVADGNKIIASQVPVKTRKLSGNKSSKIY